MRCLKMPSIEYFRIVNKRVDGPIPRGGSMRRVEKPAKTWLCPLVIEIHLEDQMALKIETEKLRERYAEIDLVGCSKGERR